MFFFLLRAIRALKKLSVHFRVIGTRVSGIGCTVPCIIFFYITFFCSYFFMFAMYLLKALPCEVALLI